MLRPVCSQTPSDSPQRRLHLADFDHALDASARELVEMLGAPFYKLKQRGTTTIVYASLPALQLL